MFFKREQKISLLFFVLDRTRVDFNETAIFAIFAVFAIFAAIFVIFAIFAILGGYNIIIISLD